MFSGRRRIGIALAAAAALFAAASPALAQRGPSRPVGAEERVAPPRQPAPQRPAPAQRQAAGGGALKFPGLPVQRPGAPAAPQRRIVPGFQLTAEDESVVQLVLQKWEEKNAGIKTFSCKFTLWEYNDDLPLNPQERQGPKESPAPQNGRLSYAAPDKGMYQVDPLPPKPGEERGLPSGGQHWVCDGKSIYQVDHEKREIVESPLPEQLQGKAIADAPLPFVFGSTADKMQRRFWLRVSTQQRNFTQTQLQPGQILLEAMPKTQQDAANFQLVQVIFLEKDMTIYAINEFLPHHSTKSEHRLTYVFDEPSINSQLERLKNLFLKPTNKLGYTHRIDKPPAVEEPPPRPLVPSANAKNRGAQLPLRR